MTDGVKTFGITPDAGFNARISALENLIRSLIIRICNLEDARDKRAFDEHAIKSQATAAQATQHLYAPLREEAPSMRGNAAAIREMKAFIERFLAFDDLGQQVDAKTRDDAREALGRARVEG